MRKFFGLAAGTTSSLRHQLGLVPLKRRLSRYVKYTRSVKARFVSVKAVISETSLICMLDDAFISILSNMGCLVNIPVTFPHRIGHLALEIDCFLKELELGDIPKRAYVLQVEESKLANSEFVKRLPPYISVKKVKSKWQFAKPLIRRPVVNSITLRNRFNAYVTSFKKTATCYQIGARWGHRSPLFKVDSELLQAKSNLFESIGWSPSQPYVVVHARTWHYAENENDLYHYCRNADITTYIDAIKWLISKGVHVVRLGDSKMPPLSQISGLYDYAISNNKSALLDLALPAQAEFFLGSCSGAFTISVIYGVPVYAANLALPLSFAPSGGCGNVGIPKLYRYTSSNKLVSFKHLYSTGHSELRNSEDIEKLGYYLVDNSPEEILELAQQAYATTYGGDIRDVTQLHERLYNLLPVDSYTYGHASTCGVEFLHRYKDLLC